MNCKYKNFLVYGTSISGEWASKLLLKKKANVFLYDDNEDNLKKLRLPGAYIMYELNENLIEQFDYIVVSPSIAPDNVHLLTAKKYGIPVFSELELASRFSRQLVAVTGTNGKTTTVQLITAILNKSHKAVSCGNIGYPLSRAVLEKTKHIMVAEVSSFMLEHIDEFHPRVSTILNISPDHLVRHKTMEEYTKLKKEIYKNSKPVDYLVVNLDEEISIDTGSMVISYSCVRPADISLKGDDICLFGEKVVSISELSLVGKHNISNVMCAIAYGYIYRVNIKKMREALLEFRLDKYRNENVGTIKGINFINDSKSTNISSTIASVNATKGEVVLLVGGSNKCLDYTGLFTALSPRVRVVIAYGEIRNDIFNSNTDFNVQLADNLDHAFDIAVGLAKEGDTLILSPATASYDEFNSYIERGIFFDNKVKDYAEKTK